MHLFLCFLEEPVERVLGRVNTQIARGTTLKCECCYDVPLLQSLQSLLLSDTIIEQVTLLSLGPHTHSSLCVCVCVCVCVHTEANHDSASFYKVSISSPFFNICRYSTLTLVHG